MKKPSFIHSKFRSLLATAFVTQAIPMLLQVSDSVIAGNVIGVDGVSAVNLVTPIYGVVAFLSMMVTVGCSILYTRASGMFDRTGMSRLFSEGLISITVLALACFAAGLLFSTPYLHSYVADGEVLYYAQEYCYYYHFVFLLTPFFLFLSELVYVEGDETVCNICYAGYFFGNILVSVGASLLMGIRGIGLGSLVGVCLGIAILCTHFFRRSNQLRFAFAFRFGEVLSMFKFSFLDASSYLYAALSIAVINKIIILRFGAFYLPVYSAVLSLIEMTAVLDGVGQAMLPLLNVFRGEHNGPGEKALIRYALKTSVVVGLAFAGCAVLAAPVLPLAFGITDPELCALAVTAVRLIGISGIASSVVYFLTSYYLVSGQILLASAVIGLNSLVFPVAFGFALCFPLGLHGLWVGYILSGLAALAATVLFILARYGKSRIPFLYEPEMCDAEIRDLTLSVPAIMETRDALDRAMQAHRVPEKQRSAVMLICEDLLQLVMEKNPGRRLLAECTLLFGDELKLIIRDSGRIFDITDEDMKVTSLRSMVVSLYLTHIHDKKYLVTTSYNRNEFCFPSGAGRDGEGDENP